MTSKGTICMEAISEKNIVTALKISIYIQVRLQSSHKLCIHAYGRCSVIERGKAEARRAKNDITSNPQEVFKSEIALTVHL